MKQYKFYEADMVVMVTFMRIEMPPNLDSN